MIPGARIVILGRQGSGKGTQCTRLSRHYVVPHISTGDMLRLAVKEGSELGIEARKYMDAGRLLPDVVISRIIADRLDRDDTRNRGFVLDGFPRTVGQAEALSSFTTDIPLDVVINLEVPVEMVLKRIAGRRVCADCGTNYSVSQPPRYDWTCDVCGGRVVQRDDDTEDAIKERLETYERETSPLIAWYTDRDLLVRVDGLGTQDEVTARLVQAIDGRAQMRATSAR